MVGLSRPCFLYCGLLHSRKEDRAKSKTTCVCLPCPRIFLRFAGWKGLYSSRFCTAFCERRGACVCQAEGSVCDSGTPTVTEPWLGPTVAAFFGRCFMRLRDMRIVKELITGTIPCAAKVPLYINDSMFSKHFKAIRPVCKGLAGPGLREWIRKLLARERAGIWPQRSYSYEAIAWILWFCGLLGLIRLIVTDMLTLTLSDTLFSPCRCHLYWGARLAFAEGRCQRNQAVQLDQAVQSNTIGSGLMRPI